MGRPKLGQTYLQVWGRERESPEGEGDAMTAEQGTQDALSDHQQQKRRSDSIVSFSSFTEILGPKSSHVEFVRDPSHRFDREFYNDVDPDLRVFFGRYWKKIAVR